MTESLLLRNREWLLFLKALFFYLSIPQNLSHIVRSGIKLSIEHSIHLPLASLLVFMLFKTSRKYNRYCHEFRFLDSNPTKRQSLSFWARRLTQCILWSVVEVSTVSIPKPKDGSPKQSWTKLLAEKDILEKKEISNMVVGGCWTSLFTMK